MIYKWWIPTPGEPRYLINLYPYTFSKKERQCYREEKPNLPGSRTPSPFCHFSVQHLPKRLSFWGTKVLFSVSPTISSPKAIELPKV